MFILLLAVILVVIVTPARAQGAADVQRYERCMTTARDEAQKGVEAALAWRREGGDAAADHCLATALVARGDASEGAQLLEQLAAEDTSQATAMRSRLYGQAGRAWLRAGESRRAWAALTDALQLGGNETDLLVDRAIALAGLRLYFEAIDDLSRALDLAPGRAEALVMRATAWRHLENLELADDDLVRALALAPNNADAFLERGNIRRLRGQNAAARADWLVVLRLDPDGPAGEAARMNIEQMDVLPNR
jgi:tetratricopeptide (TPR) repeat protein